MAEFFTGKSVYAIPAGARFMPALIEGLKALHKRHGIEAPDIALLLPNRRALRTFHESFARVSGGKPALMPRLQALGDFDEGEMVLSGFLETGEVTLPPAVDPLRRRFLIRNQLQRLAPKSAPGLFAGEQGLSLADELAALLDQMQNEGVEPSALGEIVTGNLAGHWQEMLRYLSVITRDWPKALKREGLMDPVARRNALIARLIKAWRKRPPAGVVLAAGSTGSLPPVRRLLAAIARLPNGAVILPGLDSEITEEAWQEIGETHPQYGLKKTLAEIGIAREEVRPYPWGKASGNPARAAFLSAALLPAAATPSWIARKVDPNAATGGLEVVECATQREEAGVIALILREALEHTGKTAALVTPDRGLAERVKGELARWGVEVDDSAGTRLSRTPPGAYLMLLAEMVGENFAPVPLLAFLKHPFTTANLERAKLLRRARLLDRELLRGVRPGPGLGPLMHEARALKDRKEGADILALINRLEKETAKLAALFGKKRVSFASLLAAHVGAAEALAGGAEPLYEGEAGEALFALLENLEEQASSLGAVQPEDYPALLKTLLSGVHVRPKYSRHPRLSIWGALEARLQSPDLLIFGGLNEGTWPPAPPPDPWMSREMRREAGLSTHDLRIGKAAHDFWMSAAAPNVVMTRAKKVEGTPAAPSRWLLRMQTLAGGELPLRARHPWRALLSSLDHPGEEKRAQPPAPRPPVSARPRELSVTRIEAWMRDPYSIYARHVLGLKPLDGIDEDPGAAERGTLLHEIFDAYLKEAKGDVPADGLERLIAIGDEIFAKQAQRPAIRAFWWPRFLKVAEAFIKTQRELQTERVPALLEERGRWPVPGVSPAFMVTAKADRIDAPVKDGALVVIDYKSGTIPGPKDILPGFSPQLPLEGVMAENGAFPGLKAAPVSHFEYWNLGDPKDPCRIVTRSLDYRSVFAGAREGIGELVKAFDEEATPYLASPDPAFRAGYAEYDLLARWKEWRFYPPDKEESR